MLRSGAVVVGWVLVSAGFLAGREAVVVFVAPPSPPPLTASEEAITSTTAAADAASARGARTRARLG